MQSKYISEGRRYLAPLGVTTTVAAETASLIHHQSDPENFCVHLSFNSKNLKSDFHITDMGNLAKDSLDAIANHLKHWLVTTNKNVNAYLAFETLDLKYWYRWCGREIVRNSIDEFVTHPSHESQVDIRVQSNGKNLKVTISDNGSGIPENLVSHIGKTVASNKKDQHLFHVTGGKGKGLWEVNSWTQFQGGTFLYKRENNQTLLEFSFPLAHPALSFFKDLQISNDSVEEVDKAIKTFYIEQSNLLSQLIKENFSENKKLMEIKELYLDDGTDEKKVRLFIHGIKEIKSLIEESHHPVPEQLNSFFEYLKNMNLRYQSVI